MYLSDIFEHLTYGEFAQLHIGGAETFGIRPEDYSKVISHVNLGLVELYKKFNLKTGEVIIKQFDHIQTYHLNSRFADSNNESDEPYKYIHDSIFEPFRDDVLKVEQVYNEIGMEIPLNVDMDHGEHQALKHHYAYQGHLSDLDYPEQHVRTPSDTSIQILPRPIPDNNLLIIYRASHPPITPTANNLSEIEVELPPGLLLPLLYFVAARAFSSQNTDNNSEGNNYMLKFERACQEIKLLGLYNTTTTPNTRLRRNGWV